MVEALLFKAVSEPVFSMPFKVDGFHHLRCASSDLAGKAAPHPTVNYQNAVMGGPQTGDNVTIGPTTYNSETKSFEGPWPLGPEFGVE
jgi:hypothetical protein